MFEDIGLFLVILGLSTILPPLLFSIKNKLIKKTLYFLGFIGVIVHELSHALMCIFVGEDVRKVKLDRKKIKGSVALKYPERETFLQALLTGIAPLIISSYIAWLLLTVFFNHNINDYLRIGCIILFISIIIGASPSWQDIRLIGNAAKRDLSYTLYQILLISISIPLVYLITLNLDLPYYFSPIFYILIAICYYILKYSFLAIKKLIIRIRMNKTTLRQKDIYNTKNFYKNRHKPKKHPEELIERGQW
ncbi:MAG: hypothetical protein GF317_13355 [Candidatus Lokiarchaeota archaeon]|nr:hypothetical protein [Candidatus Lokiarchaeota archaeon]MBD3200624.1 hypothetical protein [Candidatus Lokiarchaeota archaeon]